MTFTQPYLHPPILRTFDTPQVDLEPQQDIIWEHPEARGVEANQWS